jgi:hypothetical protein
LDKALALTVGKRLDRQAAKVRGELDDAREAAAADRRRAEAEGGNDLAGRLAAIDATLQRSLDRARNEVYVGYHELPSLLQPQGNAEAELEPEPAPAAPVSAPAPAPTPAPTPAPAPATEEDTVSQLHEALQARGIRCPERLVHYREEDATCPPDLEAAIGSEAVQEMQKRIAPVCMSDASSWWEVALPAFVKVLLSERARTEQDHAADMEYDATRRADAEARCTKLVSEIDELNDEISELESALERAKGREEALHAVIHRCRWS